MDVLVTPGLQYYFVVYGSAVNTTDHDSGSYHKNTSFSLSQLLSKEGYSTANPLN